MDRIFIFGAGYSARAFAAGLRGEAEIAGTTRALEKFEALRRAGIQPCRFADGVTSAELLARLATATHLVVSIAPDDAGDPVLLCARTTILTNMPELRWIGYLSTVGVYGDHGGAWVDEDSPCRPVSRRSVARVSAEEAWRELASQRDVPLAVLRLSGIYGPGRNAFVNLANGTARRLVKPGQVFNRIHVADIAAALKLLAQAEARGIFNVTDDEPAPPQDVVAYAAMRMGRAPPPEIPFDTAQLSAMARSFYGENKRVSNARIKTFGYAFRFPDYRAALDHLWESGSWAGDGVSDGRSAMAAD